MRRCLLCLLALLVSTLPGQGAAQATSTPVLIVEYEEAAIAAAAAQPGSQGTPLMTASNHSDAAAEGRNISTHRQQAMASIAAESMGVAPAVAVLTTSIALAAQTAGVKITGFKHYHTVLTGAAIRTASSRDARALKKILRHTHAVKSVFEAGTLSLVRPVPKVRLQSRRSRKKTIHSNDAADSSSSSSGGHSTLHSLTGVSKLRQQGLDGSGVLVCIIDTGVNFQQSLFGQCTALNHPEQQCKVVAGYDFVGDTYVGTRQGPGAVAGGLPTDCMGHGTMVASVVGTKNGVAPGIHLGSYRVFGCEGYVGDEVLMEAMDRAVRDGCDVINLSLASGSGYAETSMYRKVMKRAFDKGVLVVKAAGNSGADGPFRADVATAVGAITVASVDSPSSRRVTMSKFSSYGPNPNLDLLPHVAAPGGEIPVRTMDGSKDSASGTSFAAPYVSGVLAMWLQHKQQQAAADGSRVQADTVNQHAALRGLVATARGVPDAVKQGFLEPLVWQGAGVIQADAFLKNQLQVEPMMLALPSGLDQPYTTSFTVWWEGPASPSGAAQYTLLHTPAAAVSLSDGWYGTQASLKKKYAAAQVSFSTDDVIVDTQQPSRRTVKVTFTLPEELARKRLLYSGIIRLVPAAQSGLPPISIPYQGFAAPFSSLRLPASATDRSDDATALRNYANALCYSPKATPSFFFEVMDHLAKVPDVCSGGLALTDDEVLQVDFNTLHASPECSLRMLLVPEVPVQALHIQLLDQHGEVIGAMEPLVPGSGGALAKVRQVMSYCTRFDGTYTDLEGRQQVVSVGDKYKLRVLLHGPVALADVARQVSPRVEQIDVKGVFKVTSSAGVSAARTATKPSTGTFFLKVDTMSPRDES